MITPRNQFNAEYLRIAAKNGIKVVRSNPDVWFWRKLSKISPIARAFDTLFPVSRTLTFSEITNGFGPLEIPASRFLRPYCRNESAIQRLKLDRIKREMTFAAKNNRNYHLWWHPHNFGFYTEENLSSLKEISFGQVLVNLFNTARRFNMEVQPQLVLLQKTLLYIEGLGRQLYPQLDLWQTAKPFLENWVKEQMGIKAVFTKIKDNIPFWNEKLPEIPDLIYDYLKSDKQLALQQRKMFMQLQTQQQKCHKQLLLSILLATIAISAVIVIS